MFGPCRLSHMPYTGPIPVLVPARFWHRAEPRPAERVFRCRCQTAAAATATECRAVHRRLEAANIFLLLPLRDDLPFALALELHISGGVQEDLPSPSRGAFELSYILHGLGITAAAPAVDTPDVPPTFTVVCEVGDSVLVYPGKARLQPAWPGSPAAVAAGLQAAPLDLELVDVASTLAPVALASLVLVLPTDLFESERAPGSGSAVHGLQSNGNNGGWRPRAAAAGPTAQAAAAAWCSGVPSGRLSPAAAARLLQSRAGERAEDEVGREPRVVAQGDDEDEPAVTGGILRRGVEDLRAFRMPNQSNRLALVFDPQRDGTPFTFGLEVFEAGHVTTAHVHPDAHELFFVLSGAGEAFCDGVRFPVSAGSVIVFPPETCHGIDVDDAAKMYCLELMLPNEQFAEFVRSGTAAGAFNGDDLCALIAVGCSARL